MKKLIMYSLLLTMALLPAYSSALAGWFGLGEIAQAVGDTTWKVVLINTTSRALPTLLLAVVIIGAIGCFWLPMFAIMDWVKLAREAVRTGDNVNLKEAFILGGALLALLFLGWHLVEVGSLLLDSAKAGLGELNK